MSIMFWISIIFSMAVFGVVNYYIGVRILHVMGRVIPSSGVRVYWVIFWIIALSNIAAMLTRSFAPRVMGNTLMWVGSYWVGAMLYFMIPLVIFDLGFILLTWTRVISTGDTTRQSFYFISGLLAIVTAFGALGYGTWNARTPRVTTYDLDINKKAGDIKALNVVMVSDIHLGEMVGNGFLTKMVDKVNELKPDLVLLGGDIINEDAGPFVRHKMGDTLLKLKSTYGVYAILGNHEYYGGQADDIISNLTNSGVKVLRDEYIKVGDSLYIVGRDDSSRERYNLDERKPLGELMSGIDKSLPVVVLDHKPSNLNDALENGADLQLSGHTHGGGQIFPDFIFTKRMFELPYGYLAKGDTHVVVSSGFGTWGPPFRIGNISEIVQINIKFNK